MELEMQRAQQNSEMNAQIQERSAQAKMQADAAIENEKAKMKVMVEEQYSRFRNDENMQKFVHEVLLTSFKEGKELSGYIKDIVDGFFAEKARQKQMEAEAIAQQQQQAQMEYLAQQGVGPDQIAELSNQMQNAPGGLSMPQGGQGGGQAGGQAGGQEQQMMQMIQQMQQQPQ
jgi:hypothetical protein